MEISVDLQNKPSVGALEIDDEPGNDLLSLELETEHTSVAEDVPGLRLSRRGIVTELAGALKLRRGGLTGTFGHIGNLIRPTPSFAIRDSPHVAKNVALSCDVPLSCEGEGVRG